MRKRGRYRSGINLCKILVNLLKVFWDWRELHEAAVLASEHITQISDKMVTSRACMVETQQTTSVVRRLDPIFATHCLMAGAVARSPKQSPHAKLLLRSKLSFSPKGIISFVFDGSGCAVSY